MSYDRGDMVVLTASFAVNGTLTNPTTVVCKVKAPDGTVQTLTYGVDGALVRDSTGVYHTDVNVAAWGRWEYRWEGTGAAQAAEERTFRVNRGAFV